ncbi:MAG TPA: ABC transporter permease [Cyclobacteriaceae bacterium]|nr:ABC transporter permease [Cyclobacteriaceae bacterium]
MLRLAFKDLKLFFAEKRSVMLTFAVPIALITLFAFAFGGVGQDKRKARPTRVVVADEDQTLASKKIIAELDSSKELEVSLIAGEQAESAVKKGDEAAVLVLHKGLSDSLDAGKKPPIEFKYDAAKEAEIGILQGALIGKLMSIVGGKSMEKSVIAQIDSENPNLDEATKKLIHQQVSKNLSSGETKKMADNFIKTTALVAEEETSPGLVQAVAGTAIMMLLFSVVSVGASMLDEKQEGTLKKLLYAPLHPNSILFGKMIYANVISMLQLSVMFLYAKVAFGLDIFSHLPALLLMIVATAFACSSFGVLLASIGKTRQQVQGLSTLIVLIMSCIGGSMIPTFIMPQFMQKISVFSVNYWGIQGFYDIFWRSLPLTDTTFLTRILVLVAIGTVMNLIALQMFKKNVLNIA